jgi:hypothetical protein
VAVEQQALAASGPAPAPDRVDALALDRVSSASSPMALIWSAMKPDRFDLTELNWTRLIERLDLEPRTYQCRKRFSPEQIIATLFQIEV